MWKGHGGYEIALTPVIMGGFGWLVDQLFGTSPVFIVVFAVVGLFGAVANQYYRYKFAMEKATAERMAKQELNGRLESAPFGRIEYTEVDMSIDFGDPQGAAS